MTETNDTKTKPASPKACCPRDSLPPALTLHNQDPRGQMVEITPPKEDTTLVGMLPMACYCTGKPIPEASRIVVVFSDVYGINAGHHKVFADMLAERLAEDGVSTSVIVPDMFRGSPILQPWMKNDNMTKDIMGSLLGYPGMVFRLKTSYPPDKVEADIFHLLVPFIYNQLNIPEDYKGSDKPPPELPSLSCVGFCFGGWVVGRILGYRQRQALRFQCGVGIHPSFQPNILHGESPHSMAERIHRPILLLPAWNDVDLKPGTRVVNTIQANREVFVKQYKKGDKKGQDTIYEPPEEQSPSSSGDSEGAVSIEFPTMVHGWVSRGDPTDPNIAAEQERALQLTADFIRKHTASSKDTEKASKKLEEVMPTHEIVDK